jgi:hypothetical protein
MVPPDGFAAIALALDAVEALKDDPRGAARFFSRRLIKKLMTKSCFDGDSTCSAQGNDNGNEGRLASPCFCFRSATKDNKKAKTRATVLSGVFEQMLCIQVPIDASVVQRSDCLALVICFMKDCADGAASCCLLLAVSS